MSEVVNWVLLGTTFATLFVIMDPPGNVPVFLALTSPMNQKERNQAALQATITSFGVITGFSIFGGYILKFLQISVPALTLSGGILLFLVSMELLTTKGDQKPDFGSSAVNVALVPLGTPLMAGPGGIVAAMVAVEQAHGTTAGYISVGVAVILIHLVLWLSMRFANYLGKFLGEGGTLLLTKISGVLLAAIATQLCVSAVFSFIDQFMKSH